MNLTLQQILDLVGVLDDTPGDQTPRARFRKHLENNLSHLGPTRDYIYECISQTEPQYQRALIDLVNHLGQSFLGFQVNWGSYHSEPDELDGHWNSHLGWDLWLKVLLPGQELPSLAPLWKKIEEQKSSESNQSVLLLVTPPDLEKQNITEKTDGHFRLISLETLLTLADLVRDYDASHSDILHLLAPIVTQVDGTVHLLSRMVGRHHAAQAADQAEYGKRPFHWITSVEGDEDDTGKEVIEYLVNKEKVFALGENSPARSILQPEDKICFYLPGQGVVAHATVASHPEKKRHPRIKDPIRQGWIFFLDKPQFYFDQPVVLRQELRQQLEVFGQRTWPQSWAWALRSTAWISREDFTLLTRQVDDD